MTTKTTKPLIWLTTLILTTLTATLPTSCSDYTPEFDEAAYKYNQNFRDLFGNIDPNQDWNLVRQLAEKNGGGMGTRVNVPNLNQWADPKFYNLAVPGYPDALGTYYTENGYYNSIEELREANMPNPIGDVTNEEIDYVSHWFRTNYEPAPEEVYWKDYFIQDISADFDRIITSWTQDENGEKIPKEAEGDVISSAPIYDMNGVDYTYSSEIKEPEGAWTQSGSRSIKYGMEKLLIKISENKVDDVEWDPDRTFGDSNADSYWNDWEHIYNFNSGTGTNDYGKYDTKEKLKNRKLEDLTDRTIQYYRASGTADFSYHNSDANKRFHHYRLKHLVFDIPQSGTCAIHKRQCTNHHYDGYYLGFDYEIYIKGSGDLNDDKNMGDKTGTKICYKPRDGFYSNWIVKIAQGFDVEGNKPSEYPKNKIIEQGLLVCEDLGDFDYDFNDVVLKLQHIQSIADKGATPTDKLRITAMAAGGALPSRIYYLPDGDASKKIDVTPDKDEEGNEIHKLLRGAAPAIINASPEFGGEGKTWTSDPLSLDAAQKQGFASYVFDNGWIEIVVDGKTIISHAKSEYHDRENDDKATEGNAPQMMFLPINFLWPQETKFIGDAYDKFDDWVTNVNKTDWYLSPNKGLITLRSAVSSESKPERKILSTCDLPEPNGWTESEETLFEVDVAVNTSFYITLNNKTESDGSDANNASRFKYYIDDVADEDESSNNISVSGPDSGEGNGVRYTIEATKIGQTTITFTIDGYSYITVVINVVKKVEDAGGEDYEAQGYIDTGISADNPQDCALIWKNNKDKYKYEDFVNGVDIKIIYDKTPTDEFKIWTEGAKNSITIENNGSKEIDFTLPADDIENFWYDRIRIKDDNKQGIKIAKIYIRPIASSAKHRPIRRK